MGPKEIKRLLKAGHITSDQADQLLSDYKRNKYEADEADEAEQWMKKVKKAGLSGKKRMVKEKSLDLNIEAALTDDSLDRRTKSQKSNRLRFSLRGAGGMSFG
jgi:hypothetical protein